MSKLKREIRFDPAYDRRHADPKKNYGIHSVTMSWFLSGPKGTIQFVVYTNWQLPHINKEQDATLEKGKYSHLLCRPMPADLGYHSPVSMYEGEKPMDTKCEWIEGGVCYYDGSTLQAEDVFKLLVEEGHEAVWKRLEKEYEYRLENPD